MNPEKSAENFRIAIHEMGHFEAASHYRIAASPKVFSDAEKYQTASGKQIVGNCLIDNVIKPVKPFHKSVIGWSGYLAEHICGVQYSSICNPFPLQKSFLKSFYYAAIADSEKIFSYSDQVLIFGYAEPWLSFKAAYRILKKQKSKLLRMAKNYRKSESTLPDILSPEKFPATRTDFIRLICGNDEKRHEQFIVSRAITQLTGCEGGNLEDSKKSMFNAFLVQVTDEQRARHAGKTDADIADVLFDENFASLLNLRRKIYGGDFLDADSWFAAARDFLNWAGVEKNRSMNLI